MGRKKDLELEKLKSEVRAIQDGTANFITKQDVINEQWRLRLIQLRDLLTQMIEGN